MSFLNSMNIAASGLTAQQLRLDVIAENITNAQTTRTESGGAYRRKIVTFQSETGVNSFKEAMSRIADGLAPSTTGDKIVGGVRVVGIEEDPTDLKLVYDPTHPDANEDGYVEMPNVEMVKEIADAMAATQAFSANVTAINTLKSVVSKGLEIGR
jgi:flagellar basal-body rod protein FlgC